MVVEDLVILGEGELNAMPKTSKHNPSRHLWDKPKPYATIDLPPEYVKEREPTGLSDIDSNSAFTPTTVSGGGRRPQLSEVSLNFSTASSRNSAKPPAPAVAARHKARSDASQVSKASGGPRASRSRQSPPSVASSGPKPPTPFRVGGGTIPPLPTAAAQEGGGNPPGGSAVSGPGTGSYVDSYVGGKSYSGASRNTPSLLPPQTPPLPPLGASSQMSSSSFTKVSRITELEERLSSERRRRAQIESQVARSEAELARMERLLREGGPLMDGDI